MCLIIGVVCVYIGFVDQTLIAHRIVAALVGVFGATNLWAFYIAERTGLIRALTSWVL